MGEALGQDEAADLCDALYPRVFVALALYTGDEALAEDLTQEVMLRVWRSWPSAAEADRPDRWAIRVGFNLAKSWRRRLRVERRESVNDRSARIDEDLTDAIAVRAAVVELPRRQRAAIVCRYLNDFSVADTAVILGCAEGTVKALTSQGIEQLRSRLGVDIDVAEEDHP